MTHDQYLIAQIARVTARHYIELQALIIDHYANLDADTQVQSVQVDDGEPLHAAAMDVQAPPVEAQPEAAAPQDDAPPVLDQPALPRRGRRQRGAPVAQVVAQEQPDPPTTPAVTPVAVPDEFVAPLGGQNADPADLFSRWGGAA